MVQATAARRLAKCVARGKAEKEKKEANLVSPTLCRAMHSDKVFLCRE